MKRVLALLLIVSTLTVAGCGAAEMPAESGEMVHSTPDPQDDGHNHDGHNHDGYDHDFSNTEHFAARFDDPARNEWQKPEEVVSLLELSDRLVVADIGAGTGYFEAALSEAVSPTGQVLALDVNEQMVAHMQQRATDEGWQRVTVRRVSEEDPGLEPHSVDRILIVNTWHHIGDREEYVRRIRDGLRPGGFLLVVDFNEESPVGPPANMRLTAEQIAAELTEGGLRASVLAETLPYQHIVRGDAPRLGGH